MDAPDDRREAQRLLTRALAAEAAAQRELLAGVPEPAGFHEAARLYAASYALAEPGSVGRLVGMLKAAVLGGGGAEEAARVRELLPAGGASPTGWYAIAIAALIEDDDARAAEAARELRAGGPAFARAADAAAALATGDEQALAASIAAIEADFAARERHVTGVAIADTALLFTTLAERRARGRQRGTRLA